MGQRLEDHPTVKRYQERVAGRTAVKAIEPLNAKWLREAALDAGADDAGFVEIQREELADQKADILSIFPETCTLVSLVIRLNPENVRSVSRAISDLEYKEGFHAADKVARNLSARLRLEGVRAAYFASAFPMNLENWPGKMWSVSHKPVAVSAGLGHLGLHRIPDPPRLRKLQRAVHSPDRSGGIPVRKALGFQSMHRLQAVRGGMPGWCHRHGRAFQLRELPDSQLQGPFGRVLRLG